MDIGLLLIRVVLGGFLAGHGAQKLFGWFGGHGIAGTGGFFDSLGYRPGKRHAVLAGCTELAGGVLLALGFLTPLAAAMVVGLMVNAAGAVHWRNGLWVTEGGIEYPFVLGAVGAAMAFTGPGDVSIDAALDLGLAGAGWGLAATAVGVLAGAAMLMSRRPEAPVVEESVTGGAVVTSSRSETRARTSG